MPYINKIYRDRARSAPIGTGELDYKLTMCILDYLRHGGYCFSTMNEIVGVLDNVKHEFQRRVMDPYEDSKRVANGDVYDSLLADVKTIPKVL